MPSRSPKQHRFMEAAAHNPEFAKKAGIPQKVAKEFVAADKAKEKSPAKPKHTSQLALKYGKGDDVKKFAQQMIDDHTEAGADFKAALAQANVTPPKDGLDLTHKAKYERLNLFTTEKGFDASYISMQLDAHKEAVKLFEDYVQNGSPGPVKDFASKTLPTLKHHLEMVTAPRRGMASRALKPGFHSSGFLASGFLAVSHLQPTF